MSRFRSYCDALAITMVAFMVLGRVAKAATGRHVLHTTGDPAGSTEAAAQFRPGHLAETKPDEDLSLPNQSTDEFREITSILDGPYDNYGAFKTEFNNDYNIQYSLLVSSIGQRGVR